MARDRDAGGRARNARPRDGLGRLLPRDSQGVEPISDDPHLDGPQTLRRAQELLDAQCPFQAHEVLEARWKTGPDGQRQYWQGLAQAAVALTHLKRGNLLGARRLAQRAQAHLAAPTPVTGGASRDDLHRQLEAIAQGTDNGLRIVSGT